MALSKAAQAALAAATARRTAQQTAAAGRAAPARKSAQQLALNLKQVPVLSPLDDAPEPTGDIQADTLAELGALDAALADPTGFIQRARAEDNRKASAVDSMFFFTVGFLSRQDKDRFLAAARLVPVEVYGDYFLDGYAVAAALGIDMSEEEST